MEPSGSITVIGFPDVLKKPGDLHIIRHNSAIFFLLVFSLL